jgi:hypothetical protein
MEEDLTAIIIISAGIGFLIGWFFYHVCLLGAVEKHRQFIEKHLSEGD